MKKQKKDVPSQVSSGCDVDDFVRWKNCMDRDFTINRQIIIIVWLLSLKNHRPFWSFCKLRSIYLRTMLYLYLITQNVQIWMILIIILSVHSLFFDPTCYTIYDYVGGVRDLRTLKVITSSIYGYKSFSIITYSFY